LWVELTLLAVILTGAATLAMKALGPHLLGHDDSIYVVTALSLKETGEYKLRNLPSQPPQTKYPPLYPLTLTAMLAPQKPIEDQVVRLKTLNVAFFVVTLFLVWQLLGRVGEVATIERLLAIAALALSPGFLSSTDWVMSEQLFTMLLVAVVGVAADSTVHGKQRAVAAAALAAMSMLTRTVGIAACVGLVWHLAATRSRRTAVVAAAVILALTIPWWAWAVVSHPSTLNPLEEYYVSYERSAWFRLFEEPAFATRMLWANSVGLLTMLPTVAGAVFAPVAIAAGLLALAGFVLQRRTSAGSLIWRISALYVVIVTGHPMNMGRYLIPLMPFAFCLAAWGAAGLRTRLRPNALAVIGYPIFGLLLLLNVLWTVRYERIAGTGMQAGYGVRLPYDWVGFQETIDWIKHNTPRDAVFAAGYDTTYAAYTGRRALRPWIHEPETYDPRYGRYLRFSWSQAQIRPFLQRAGVSFVIVDPQLPDGLGTHAASAGAEVAGDGSGWTLRFTSSDGRHRVYERNPN
jgi:hypothetical protein